MARPEIVITSGAEGMPLAEDLAAYLGGTRSYSRVESIGV
jgi:hypothetical protein